MSAIASEKVVKMRATMTSQKDEIEKSDGASRTRNVKKEECVWPDNLSCVLAVQSGQQQNQIVM